MGRENKKKYLKYETRKGMNEFQQYETIKKVFIHIKLIQLNLKRIKAIY